MPRTTPRQLSEEAVETVAVVLADVVGASVAAPTNSRSDRDLTATFADGSQLDLVVKAMAHADPGRVRQMVESQRDRRPRGRNRIARMVVADEIPERAKQVLRAAGWGWLDRRGHLAVQAPGVVVDTTAIPSIPRTRSAVMRPPVRGRSGLTVAAVHLLSPDDPPGVRDIARRTGLAPSSVSAAQAALRNASLLSADGRPLVPELFWALAEAWQPDQVVLAEEPAQHRPGRLRFRLDDLTEPGWALTGTLAAAAWGAPVVTPASYPPDFVVPSPLEQRTAVRALGEATVWEQRACTVGTPPVPLVVTPRYAPRQFGVTWLSWPVVHPLFAALDLAQDRARGIEILEAWSPPEPFARVW